MTTPVEWGLLAAAVIGTGVSIQQNAQAQKAQRKAERKTADIQNRSAELENQRNARRAIAQRRVQQSELIAAAQVSNTGANSAVAGAVGSLTTQTAANIGFASQQLAADRASQYQLFRGAKKAGRHMTNAGIASGVGQLAMLGLSMGMGSPKPQGRQAPAIYDTMTIKP